MPPYGENIALVRVFGLLGRLRVGYNPQHLFTDGFGICKDRNGISIVFAHFAPVQTGNGNWQMLMIVLHPNGDPKDMKNMVGALAADLK